MTNSLLFKHELKNYLKFSVIEFDILWSTLKSTATKNIPSCGILIFQLILECFGGIY